MHPHSNDLFNRALVADRLTTDKAIPDIQLIFDPLKILLRASGSNDCLKDKGHISEFFQPPRELQKLASNLILSINSASI